MERNNIQSEYKPEDIALLTSVGLDLTGLVASFVPGGGIVSTGTGLLSTAALFGSDVMRDGLDWGDVKNAAFGAGLDLVSFMPVLGSAAKYAKTIKKLKRIAPIIIKTFGTAMGVAGFASSIQAFEKLINDPNNINPNDIRLMADGVLGLTGIIKTGYGKDVTLYKKSDIQNAVYKNIATPMVKKLQTPEYETLSRFLLPLWTHEVHNGTSLETKKIISTTAKHFPSYLKHYSKFRSDQSPRLILLALREPTTYEGYVHGVKNQNGGYDISFRRPTPDILDQTNPNMVGFFPEYFKVGDYVFADLSESILTEMVRTNKASVKDLTYHGKIIGKGIEKVPCKSIRDWISSHLNNYPGLDKDIFVIEAAGKSGKIKGLKESGFIPYTNDNGNEFDISSKAALKGSWTNIDGSKLWGNVGGHHVILGTIPENGVRVPAAIRVDIYKFDPVDYFQHHIIPDIISKELKRKYKNHKEIIDKLILMSSSKEGINKAFNFLDTLGINTGKLRTTQEALTLYDSKFRPFVYITSPEKLTPDLLKLLDSAYDTSAWYKNTYDINKSRRIDRVMDYILAAVYNYNGASTTPINAFTGKYGSNKNFRFGGSINYLQFYGNRIIK